MEVALDHVSIKIYRGQITGLIGENGSGKSTIASILSGMQPPASGEMFFKGKSHKPSSMIEGAALGIGMIVQEQDTVPGISIAENIFLGSENKFGKRRPVVRHQPPVHGQHRHSDRHVRHRHGIRVRRGLL